MRLHNVDIGDIDEQAAENRHHNIVVVVKLCNQGEHLLGGFDLVVPVLSHENRAFLMSVLQRGSTSKHA